MNKPSSKSKQVQNLPPDLEKLQLIAEEESSATSDLDLGKVALEEKKELEQPVQFTPIEIAELLSDTENASRQKADLEIETLKIKNKELDYKLAQLQRLDSTRGKYVFRLFCLIVAWLTVVVIFVALTATLSSHFKLSDSVLIAFITSTTVSVLGLFVIVARWLFPSANGKAPND